MKLLMCKKCMDVFSLALGKEKNCSCGAVGGIYKDELFAQYWGGDNAIPLGFANSSLAYAIVNQPSDGMGETFNAFVIPKKCQSFVMIDYADRLAFIAKCKKGKKN